MSRLTEDAPDAAYHLTENGWPDGEGFYKFCKHLVAWMKKRKLNKLLLLLDGHDDHFHLPSLMLLRLYNVRMFLLPPGCTGKMQPLDVGVFGALERLLTRYINELFGVVTNADWARLVTRAYKEWAAEGLGPKGHILVNSFRHAGIYPANVNVFTMKDWMRSDVKLGLSENHPDVKKAMAMKLSELSVVLKSSVSAARPEVKVRLEKAVRKGGFDLNLVAPTDDDMISQLLDKAEAADKEASDLAERKKIRAEKRVLKAQEKEATALRVAAKKKAKEDTEAEKAAKVVAAVVAAPQPGGKVKKRRSIALVAEEDGEEECDPYAKSYVSHAGSKRARH